MKISQKQASLLAIEVFNELKKKSIGEVAPILLVKVKEYKKERNRLIEVKNVAEKAIDNHDAKLKTILGKSANKIRGYWDEENIIEKLREANTPTLTEIEDKIILNAMFSTDEDLQTFVAGIVKKFTKRKQTIPS